MPTSATRDLIDELKALFEHHKGEAEVRLLDQRRDGDAKRAAARRRVQGAPLERLRAELGHVLGVEALAA